MQRLREAYNHIKNLESDYTNNISLKLMPVEMKPQQSLDPELKQDEKSLEKVNYSLRKVKTRKISDDVKEIRHEEVID